MKNSAIRRMQFIKDSNVFKAVNFARHLVNEDDHEMGLAIYKASKYYEVSTKKVASEMGKFATNVRYNKIQYKADE